MNGKKSGTGPGASRPEERPGKPAARIPDPTHCDSCGKPLGVWFSLADKAYCSPCFHKHFWTPFQSVPGKAH